MDEALLKEAMRELGRKSAAARKAKYGSNYMKEFQAKGAAARRKENRSEHKSEPLKKSTQKKKLSMIFEL